jgi:hypothetical protein
VIAPFDTRADRRALMLAGTVTATRPFVVEHDRYQSA